VLTQSKTSFKNFAIGSLIDAKKKIFRPIGVIDFLARIRFALWTSELMTHRMLHCSDVAMLIVAWGRPYKYFLFPLLTFAYNKMKWKKIMYHAYYNYIE